jgi:hypothetical protein
MKDEVFIVNMKLEDLGFRTPKGLKKPAEFLRPPPDSQHIHLCQFAILANRTK